MEVIHLPLAFVSDFSVWVKKRAKPVHLAIQPMTMVFAAVDVEKCTESISLIVLDFPNVLSSRRVNDTPDFVLVGSRLIVVLFGHA